MSKGMSSLESLIATGGEAPMLDSLDFTLPPASTACVDRRQHVRAYPTSASTLSPNGTRTVRIRLGGDDFVDSHSVRIMYTIKENSGTTVPPTRLQPLCGPWGAWGQVYLRSNGVELDNIPAYGRFHQQYGFNQLSQLEQFGESGICGFAGSETTGTLNTPSLGYIEAGRSYTVMHKLHLSLFSSSKLLPTRYAPLEVEMTLGNAADWLYIGPQGLNWTGAGNYTIDNIQLLYHAYALDETVQESFYKALLSSRVLSVPTMTVYQVVHQITPGATSFSLSTVRAFSRLSHVWLTFRNNANPGKSYSFICPSATGGLGATPALSDGTGPSVRLSIGPHNWPDAQPANTIPELFYQFQQALPGTPNITRDNFLQNAFTIVFDVRKVPSDPTSSISTRSGDLLRIDLQNLVADQATECWVTLFAFSVTAIRESGVTLMT